MSSPLVSIASRSSPCEAADVMLQHNVRYLLVIDNADKPIGTPLDFTDYK